MSGNLVIGAVVQEVVEVSVRNSLSSVRPLFHGPPPTLNVDEFGPLRAVDGAEGAVDKVDVVLLRDGASLVSAGTDNVPVDVGAKRRHSAQFRNRLVSTRAAGKLDDALRALAGGSGDTARLAPDKDGVLELLVAVSRLGTTFKLACVQ